MSAIRRIFALAFVSVGVLHFLKPRSFEAIMPAWIPMHKEAVAVSGAAEIAGGLALLPERTARFGGYWLIALMLAVFPANIHMAVNPEQVRGLEKSGMPGWALWLRLPLQPLAMWLLWRASKGPAGD